MTGYVPWLRERAWGARDVRGEGGAPPRGCTPLSSPAAARSSAHMEYRNRNSFYAISQVLEFYGDP